MNVQVKVCEQGALRNGRFAFTDRFTLVTELLQNARRAGATEIAVEYDAQQHTLQVTDNGAGIEDFQSLLTFNESGWSPELKDAERPFGVGFSTCLYAAKRVTVTSRGKRLEFDCDAALRQDELEVRTDDQAPADRTTVRLEGVNLEGLVARFPRMVRGFPVQVSFNGTIQQRMHAIGSLPFVVCDIGHVYLAGAQSGLRSTGTAMYLQGLEIAGRDYFCHNEQLDVIHLDSKRFLARLPDRKTLIDASEQEAVIWKAVRALWRDVLQGHKAALSPLDFVDRFFGAARAAGHVDLFDDVPLLPSEACDVVTSLPILDQDMSFLATAESHVQRSQVEDGTVHLAEVDSDDGEGCLLLWTFAKARGLTLVNTERLGDAHWSAAHVRRLSTEDIAVSEHGPMHVTEFDGRWVCPTVHFCESVLLRHGDDAVELFDVPVVHAGKVYFPSLATGGDVVRQISSYIDGDTDRFVHEDAEADTYAFADFVRRLRSTDPVATLSSLMRELSLERYPLLSGRTFRIAVGTAPAKHAVELVD